MGKLRATYRGYERSDAPPPEAITVGRVEIALGATADVGAADLSRALDADAEALFDVEPVDVDSKPGAAERAVARELERRGVSVHPAIGGSAKPKGHPRWGDE